MSKAADNDEKVIMPLPTWKIWYLMVVLYILYLLDFATRTVISPMFPILQKELGLTDTQLGWLSTIVLAMVGLLSLPLSYVIDRWRRGRMISLMSIVWSIASFCSGLAANFGQLISARAILGVGEASFNSGGQALLMASVKKSRRATLTGIWTTAAAVGTAIGMVIGGAVAIKYGWRTAFMAVAIPGIIFGILAWFIPDYKNQPKDANGQVGGMSTSFAGVIKDILKVKTLVTLFISFGLAYLFSMSIMYWLPTYFNRFMGMDVALAGTLTGAIMLTALVAGPVGGILGDRMSKNKPRNKVLLCWICIIICLVFFVAAVALNIWWLFFIVVFCQFAFIPVQHTASQEVVPFYQRATAYGAYIFSMFFFGGLWGPAVTGAISDASNLQIAFWVNGAILLIASIGYLIMYKTFDADYYSARKKEEGVEVQVV
ncbi:MAG: MFS transporter [Dehalococcoidia bacterium]|nr:MFS transporter [Dehalococcoidia bacterium]MDD5647995.1 MFS transporter [Dehalococcoidia bacterium]